MKEAPTSAWTYATNNRIAFYRRPPGEGLLASLAQNGLDLETGHWLLSLGALYVDGKRATSDQTLPFESVIRIHLQPRRFAAHLHDWSSALVYEHPDWIVVNKPSGIPTHPTLDNAVENAQFQMQEILGEELFVTHRLDVETEGLLLFSRNREAAAQINSWLQTKRIKRLYQAWSQSSIAPGVYVHYMEKSPRSPKKVTLHPPGLECQLQIWSSESTPQGYCHTVELGTGRTHQIRAQLAALGAPLRGDSLYGGAPGPFGLQAVQLELLPLKITITI